MILRSLSKGDGKSGGHGRRVGEQALRACYLKVCTYKILAYPVADIQIYLSAEFTTLLNRPPVIMPREMQCRLPCSDETWNASTAHDWASLYYGKEASLQCNYAACDVVDCRPSVLRELAKQARTSAFSTTVL
jgi:hypothetical protein